MTRSGLLGIALFVVAGCDGSLLELGGNDAGDASSSGEPTLACPPINETQYATLRGETCAGVCSDAIASPRALALPEEVAAALAGQWTLCGGALGPSDTVGIELDPGCVVYLLRSDADGGLARGTTTAYQGTFDIMTRGNTAIGVAVHLSTGTIEASVVVSGCLGRARWIPMGTSAGDASIELAAVLTDGGPPAH